MTNKKPLPVHLSKRANQDLDTIYGFVLQVFGAKTARETIKGIRQKLIWISKHPEASPLDQLFFDPAERKIRYANYKRSKIIYLLNSDGVQVLRILDTRQDPENQELQ